METPETLGEESLAFQPAKSPIAEDKTLKEASATSDLPGSIEIDTKLKLPAEVSITGVQGNGVNASVDNNEGVDGDVVVAAAAVRVVETDVLIERRSVTGIDCFEEDISVSEEPSMVGNEKNGGIGGGVMKDCLIDDGVAAETRMKGGSLGLLENGEESEPTHKGSKEDGESRLNVDDSAKKVGVSRTGISLLVEVHGSSACTDKDNGSELKCLSFSATKESPTSESEVRERSKRLCKEDGSSSSENGGNPDAKVTELPRSMIEIKNCGIVEGEGKEKVEDPSMKKKRKRDSEVENDNDEAGEALGSSKSASPSKKGKKTRLLGSPATTKKKTSSVENGDSGAKEERNRRSISRDRKKSKYLSPPYTDLGLVKKSLISVRDSETETPEVSPGGEECIRSGQVIGYSPKPSEKPGIRCTTLKRKQKKMKKIVLEDSNASPDDMLSELLSTALDAQYLKENQSSDSIEGFFSRFRSSMYHNGSNYEVYNKHLATQAGTKRESLGAKPGLLREDLKETDHLSPQGKSEQKKKKRKEEAISESPQIKVAYTKRESLDAEPGLLQEDLKETDHLSPQGKSEQKKRKRKEKAISHSPQIKLAGTKRESLDAKPGLLREDSKETDHLSAEGKSEQKKRKRKEKAISESPQINLPGAKRESLDAEPGLLREDSKETDLLSPQGKSEQKKRKRKEKAISESPQIKLAGTKRETLDAEPGLLQEDSKEPDHLSPQDKSEQKKRKRKEKAISESPQIKLVGSKRESLDSEPGLLREDSKETDHLSPQGNSEQTQRKRMEETISESPQIKLAGTKRESLDAEPGLLRENLKVTDHLSPQGKSEQKKRKRKEKAISASPQIKLASTMRESLDAEPGLLREDSKETDHLSPQGKSEQRQGKRMEEAISEIPQIKVAGTMRESFIAEPGLLREDLQETNLLSPEGKSEQKKRKTIVKAKSENPQIKLAAGTSDVKTKHKKDRTNGESSQAALLLTFAPGYSLPSKDDLIMVFGRFGALNKIETEVLQDSGCAQVVYIRSSDAEEAVKNLQKINPFGPSVISYGLRYIPEPLKFLELVGNSSQAPLSHPPKGGETLKFLELVGNSSQAPLSHPPKGGEISTSLSVSQPPAGEAPPLHSIRQNLEMMTSMLEKSGDKLSPKVKANLEGEIKGLLKKISTMRTSSS